MFLFQKLEIRSKDLQVSLQTESTTFKAALPSQDQNNPNHNSSKDSSENLPRLNVTVIASLGTDLFRAPHERPYTTTINSMNGIVKAVITVAQDERGSFHSGKFTVSKHNTSARQLACGADLPLISDERGSSSYTESAQDISGIVAAAAHPTRCRVKIAASLHTPHRIKELWSLLLFCPQIASM